MRWLIALGLALAPHAALAQRVELPIKERDLSDGTRRYAVTIRIDGRAAEAGLDTGSTGLRVLPRGLGVAGNAAKGPHARYAYGAGTQFDGPVVSVNVDAGGLAGSIKIMRIDRIGCRDDKPKCPAATADPARFGIQGDGYPGEGFVAILGTRLQHDEVDNPFVELGAKRWIVELPRPGESVGRLVINPTDDEVAAYQRVAVDDAGTSGGCLVGPAPLGRICGRTFFDSGAPGLRVIGPGSPTPWPDGTPVTIAIGDGHALASMMIEAGRRDQASAMLHAPAAAGSAQRLSLGLAPYFHWSVLYDAERRQIGLKTR